MTELWKTKGLEPVEVWGDINSSDDFENLSFREKRLEYSESVFDRDFFSCTAEIRPVDEAQNHFKKYTSDNNICNFIAILPNTQ